MKIGILPVLKPYSGGIYQYSLSMLRALDDWKHHGGGDEFTVFVHDPAHPALGPLITSGWTIESFQPLTVTQSSGVNALRRMIPHKAPRQALRWMRRQFNRNVSAAKPARIRSEISDWIRRCKVDVMLYPAPDTLSFETGLPYVMAIHDLQHRLQPEFPEVSADGEWERREYLFSNGARYATLILADSEVGREDILNIYGSVGVTPDRVRVLPYLPSSYLASDISENTDRRVRTTYDLPARYLFYPAQFWPHKNHARIIKALGLLKQQHGLLVPLILTGSNSGDIRQRTFNEIMALSAQFGLEKDIRHLGYVADADMSSLYAGAIALVMPTFFGPTNIPVLEAWTFGCPVLTSDIRGIREQASDASVLVDPRSVEAIADGIYRLWTDEHLRRTLATRGKKRLSGFTSDEYRNRLQLIVQDAKELACTTRRWARHGPAS